MAEGCLTLEPFQECGWGECVSNECVCAEGYSQNFEFFYIDVNKTIVTDCNYSVQGMLWLAGSLLALTCATFVLQIYVVRNRRQFKRTTPILVGYIFLIVHLSMRINLVDQSPFGEDPIYTFFLTWSFMLLFVQQVIYYNKYTSYLVRTFDVRPETKRLAKISVRVQDFLLAVLVVGFNLWWSTSFVESLEVKNSLAMGALAVQALQQFMFLLNGVFLLTRYLKDLRSITDRSEDMKVQPEVVRKLKRNIIKTKNIRLYNSLINFGGVLAAGLPLIQPGWLKYWVYLIYIIGIVFQLGSGLVICFAARRRMFRTRRQDHTTATGLAADVEYKSFLEDESSDYF